MGSKEIAGYFSILVAVILGHSLIEKQDGTHFRWFATG